MAEWPKPNSTSEAPDLGVLFVHGIGHQSAGQTLVQFGDPIFSWLDEWLRPSPQALDELARSKKKPRNELSQEEVDSLRRGRAAVGEASVASGRDSPPHATADLQILHKGVSRTSRWLVAESCWANAFAAPTFGNLAFWGLAVYPYTNAVHFGAQMRRLPKDVRGSRAPRPLAVFFAVIAFVFLVVASVLVSIVVVAILVLLTVLAIPPIPTLRRMLLRIQQRLADSVGDSFILVVSPIQRAAIVSHVRRDLDWLMKQGCEKIVIIAHSQGAAVAFETLRTGIIKGRSARDTMLVTLGSGLGKLLGIERAIILDQASTGWIPIAGLTLIALALEYSDVIDLVPIVGRSPGFAAFCGVFGLIFWLGGAWFNAANKPDARDFEPSRHFGAGVMWRDYYASQDPVSNGSLLDKDPPFLTSQEIYNRAAPWSDHTTYWLNRDEFVPSIIRDLDSFSGLGLLRVREGDENRVATAARRRRWRVQWLVAARLVACVLGGMIVFARWEELPVWGGALLRQLPTVEKALDWIGAAGFGDARLAEDLVARYVAGIALVAVSTTLGYNLLFLFWRAWTWRDTRALLKRESYGAERPYWLFVFVLLVLANAGLLIAIGWLREHPPSQVTENDLWILSLLVPGFVGGFFAFVVRLAMRSDSVETILESGVVMLVAAPFVAMNQMAEWEEPTSTVSLLGFVGLTVVLILTVGDRALPEHQGWASAKPAP